MPHFILCDKERNILFPIKMSGSFHGRINHKFLAENKCAGDSLIHSSRISRYFTR